MVSIIQIYEKMKYHILFSYKKCVRDLLHYHKENQYKQDELKQNDHIWNYLCGVDASLEESSVENLWCTQLLLLTIYRTQLECNIEKAEVQKLGLWTPVVEVL